MSKTMEEAFEEWDTSRVPLKYQSRLDRRAAFVAGAAHGAAEEREAVLAIIADVEADDDIAWTDEDAEIVARIRQRGKK